MEDPFQTGEAPIRVNNKLDYHENVFAAHSTQKICAVVLRKWTTIIFDFIKYSYTVFNMKQTAECRHKSQQQVLASSSGRSQDSTGPGSQCQCSQLSDQPGRLTLLHRNDSLSPNKMCTRLHSWNDRQTAGVPSPKPRKDGDNTDNTDSKTTGKER